MNYFEKSQLKLLITKKRAMDWKKIVGELLNFPILTITLKLWWSKRCLLSSLFDFQEITKHFIVGNLCLYYWKINAGCLRDRVIFTVFCVISGIKIRQTENDPITLVAHSIDPINQISKCFHGRFVTIVFSLSLYLLTYKHCFFSACCCKWIRKFYVLFWIKETTERWLLEKILSKICYSLLKYLLVFFFCENLIYFYFIFESFRASLFLEHLCVYLSSIFTSSIIFIFSAYL